ncbi:MAG: hypothetical protein WBM35_06545 [Candidatus Electrothrix sp.]
MQATPQLSQDTAPYAPPASNQDLPSSPSEQLAYNRQVLQPIRATVRGRIPFYAQRVKSWQELEQSKSRYRTPEQSRKLISCQNKVTALHDAYTALQIQLFNDRNIADSHESIIMSLQHLQNRDFTYLEGMCPALFKQLSAEPLRIVPPVIPEDIPEEIVDPISGAEDSSESPQSKIIDFTNYQQNQYRQNINSPAVDLLALTDPTPNYEERYQYAQSLLKQGKEQESRGILRDLLANVRQTGNRTLQIKILKKISTLEFALRNYLPAKILYEELQQMNAAFDKQHLAALQSIDSQREKVDAYAALLLSSMTPDPEQDGFTVVQQARAFIHNFPDSPLRFNVENMEVEAKQVAEQWFQGLLQKFDRLVANQQRRDALALLEKVPLDILPLDKQDIVQQRKNSLTIPPPVYYPVQPPVQVPVKEDLIPSPEAVAPDITVTGDVPQEVQSQPNTVIDQEPADQEPTQATQAQDQDQAMQPAELSTPKETNRSSKSRQKTLSSPEQPADTALQKKWDVAEKAFQATEYDKAIALYTDMLNTSLDTQARKKMKKASLAAGQKTRKKAANFFQRANSATDPKVRKQHLLSSKTLLEGILQKYPLAELDAKVKRNLSRVDKELAALDHTSFE